MDTLEVWHKYAQQLYFFILKTVQDKHVANDILQNSFLKVHSRLPQLKNEQKLKAWVFQIGRNEITNHFNREEKTRKALVNGITEHDQQVPIELCCFDKFIDDLPSMYKQVVELTYIEGKRQEEVSEILSISSANVKARIRRSKAMLKKQFQECCQYDLDAKGNLTGTANCTSCE